MQYVATPTIPSIIDVKKTPAWGESGFPAKLLAGDFGLTKGVRVAIPISLRDDDYASLAASFIGSETGEGETSLIQVVDLLATGQSLPACQQP